MSFFSVRKRLFRGVRSDSYIRSNRSRKDPDMITDKQSNLLLLIATVALVLTLSSCSSAPDSPAEEYLEAKIRDYTGLDIDLTSEDGK